MSQGRSVWRQIFKNFILSLTPKKYWGECVGKDYMGTEYYEIPPGMQQNKTRNSRWFVPVVQDKFNQEIPPEWQAWLRHRRKDPPTEEEIQTNLLELKQRVENAQKLETSKPKTETVPEKPPDQSFPSYKEYSINPKNK